METRQDFFVGLLIVAAIGIVVGALIATSGWGEGRYDLFIRVASAQNLTVDTKVYVQGLEIGRVKSIAPRVDSVARTIAFVAKLSVAERFADGATLQLPVGTRAEIVQVSAVSSASAINLILPDSLGGGRAHAVLAAGDTIDSQRKSTALDALTDVAAQLSKEVEEVLRQTHRTLVRVQATVALAERTLRETAPDIRSTLAYLASTMGRVDTVAARVGQAGLPDSLTAALASSNRLLLRLDSLTTQAQALTLENRDDVRRTVVNLNQLSSQLSHFVDQMSRRPYRLLTGVKPLPALPDTARAADPATRAGKP